MDSNHNNNTRFPPRPYMKRKVPEPEIAFTPHDRTIGETEGQWEIL